MTALVFDIETIPDVEAGRKLHNLTDLSDQAVGEAMFAMQQAKSGSRFLPHYLQRIIAISVLVVDDRNLKVWSLGEFDSSEADIIQRFFKGIEKYKPTLVSWNGSGFDLPVLHYRALRHGISAKQYWEMGEHDNQFKWNNYLNRFHYRHFDLMDVLAGYQNRAFAPLDHIASLLNLPGKMGQSGKCVWSQFLENDIKGIRDYCETDVLNTYLVYLHVEQMRGVLDESNFIREKDRLKKLLTEATESHLQDFLNAWSDE